MILKDQGEGGYPILVGKWLLIEEKWDPPALVNALVTSGRMELEGS